MIGLPNAGTKGLAPIGAGWIKPKLRDLISMVNKKTQNLPLSWDSADNTSAKYASDHYPFHLEGIPSVFFYNGSTPNLHTFADDAETIDYIYYEKECRLIYEVMLELANGNALQ